MVLTTFRSEALNGLCSQDRLDLMDSIDTLRSQGIDHFVSLPQIIVCGDQSSGKSSVLEAVSGVPFPVRGNLCTRFPTELSLRRTSHVGARISIVPHHSRSEIEKATLTNFEEELEDFSGFSTLVETAKSVMGISTRGRTFAKDLLRVEISGPDRPHLTIVDLPGLIHSQTKHQTASDVQLIQEVVESYMREPRSIILAVISAKNDFANQIVLKLARSADPHGNRTLGVITKPDTLHPGSESEALYVSLAKNQEVEFRLGWHVLKNMDSEAGRPPLFQRNIVERRFFDQGIWPELPHTALGIDQLRKRLSKVLLGHITSELPSLVDEIESKRNVCRDRLAKLGKPRVTSHDQQLFLIGVSESFQRLVKSATDGDWNDVFFDDDESDNGYRRRLRAVIQNNNDDFAKKLSRNGHRRHISGTGMTSLHTGTHITRDAFIEHIELQMRSSRGRELPGMFDPMIVASLFRDQAGPWERLVRDHVDSTWKACKVFLQDLIAHISDPSTSEALLQKIIAPAMNKILVTVMAKTDDLLKNHQKLHPITYNHYLTDNFKKIQANRKWDECASIVKSFFNVLTLGPYELHTTVDLSTLVNTLARGTTEPDMNRSAASEALDRMQAYYKVAMKRFIDDVAVEIIEVGLVSSLAEIMSPVEVYKMEGDLVAQIAGESEDSQAYRDQLNKQLEVLGKGAEICEQFAFVKTSVDNVAIVGETANSRTRANEHKDIAPDYGTIPSHISDPNAYVDGLGEESSPSQGIIESDPEDIRMPEPEGFHEAEAEGLCEPALGTVEPGDACPTSFVPKKMKKKKKAKTEYSVELL